MLQQPNTTDTRSPPNATSHVIKLAGKACSSAGDIPATGTFATKLVQQPKSYAGCAARRTISVECKKGENKIRFRSDINQALADESWAFSNVHVFTDNTAQALVAFDPVRVNSDPDFELFGFPDKRVGAPRAACDWRLVSKEECSAHCGQRHPFRPRSLSRKTSRSLGPVRRAAAAAVRSQTSRGTTTGPGIWAVESPGCTASLTTAGATSAAPPPSRQGRRASVWFRCALRRRRRRRGMHKAACAAR